MIDAIAAAVLYLAPVSMPPERARAYAVVIVRECKRNEVDPLVIVALMYEENKAFDPMAMNPKTEAAGLLQLAPVHWRGKHDPTDWRWNLRFGIRYLARLMNKCETLSGAISLWNSRGSCRESVFSGWVLVTLQRLERFRGRSA